MPPSNSKNAHCRFRPRRAFCKFERDLLNLQGWPRSQAFTKHNMVIKGHISQIIGPVVDVHFETAEGQKAEEHELPSIHDALAVTRPGGRRLIIKHGRRFRGWCLNRIIASGKFARAYGFGS